MRERSYHGLLALLVLPSAFAAREANCGAPFEAGFRSGAELQLQVRSGDIEIIGWDESSIRVTCEVRNEGDGGGIDMLRIRGGPREGVRMRIHVPRESHLVVRGTAGDLDLAGIYGDKDVSLRAGDLTIDVGNPADYAAAQASVTAGDLHARP